MVCTATEQCCEISLKKEFTVFMRSINQQDQKNTKTKLENVNMGKKS